MDPQCRCAKRRSAALIQRHMKRDAAEGSDAKSTQSKTPLPPTRTQRLMRTVTQLMEYQAPSPVAAVAVTSADETRDCAACLNLDYKRYTSFAPHLYSMKSGDFSPSPPARFKLAAFNDVKEAAAGSCSTCRILQRAIDFFWNSIGLDAHRRRSAGVDRRRFQKALCLVVQPGRSLLLFRVLLYDDLPDRSFVHAVTIRDAASRIEFYRHRRRTDLDLPHGPCPAIGWASHVSATVTLEQAVELAKHWIKGCDEQHPKCAVANPRVLPNRLVDVQEGVRLIDTMADGVIDRYKPYMTLSHCWGKNSSLRPVLKTTHDTIYHHQQGILWEALPPLFQDAILLVRALGRRYIWIDSLCIIQDDCEDWTTELTKMSEVYNNSELNIAATAMRNSSAGLFRRRIHGQGFRHVAGVGDGTVEHGLETIEIEAVESEDSIYARVSHDRSHEVLYGDIEYFRTPMEPLLSRAWVFQERLLSRRTLHFGASELLWECRTDCFCECSRIGDAHALSARKLNSSLDHSDFEPDRLGMARYVRPKKVLFFDVCSGLSSALDFWLRAVEEYSFLYLSRERDRPFALAGIAQRMHRLTGHVYLAGLWLDDLPRALVWSPCRSKRVGRAENGGIPSWSWMSRTCFPQMRSSTCAVRYKHVTQFGFVADDRLTVHAKGTFCRYEQNNQFGFPVAGQVHISAASRWGTVDINTHGKHNVQWTGRNELHIVLQQVAGEQAVCIPFLADRQGEEPQTVRLWEEVLCVLIGRREAHRGAGTPYYLLVLVRVDGNNGLWERIGFSETSNKVAMFDVAPVLDLKIV